jgi:hypothetical protein
LDSHVLNPTVFWKPYCAGKERLRYDSAMKTPPDNPEFVRFTAAMRSIMKVSKVELQRRMDAAKRKPKFRVSRALRDRPKGAL